MGKCVKCEIQEEIALVTLDNPPVNAFSKPLIQDFTETFRELKRSKIRAVIITGAGKAFQAGADINLFLKVRTEGDGYELVKMFQELVDDVADMEVPVIAAVNGIALGGGTELSLTCDIRVASSTAKFGLTEVSLGIIPGGGGTQRLPRLIGPGRAKYLILTGRNISATEALEIGLVDLVVEADQLLPEAMKIAQMIARNSPAAVRAAKRAINEGLDVSLRDGLLIERKYLALSCGIGDQMEGAKAFLEKRKPTYVVR